MVSRRNLVQCLSAAALALSGSQVFAAAQQPFSQARFDAVRAAGGPVMVFIAADWCPTCRAQAPIITQIGNEAAFASLQIFRLDYDTQKALRRALRASRQATLIVYKNGVEVGRSVGAVDPAAIRTLMQLTNR